MAVYSYEAVSSSGKIVRSTYEAADREGVLEMLKEKNLYPVKIDLATGIEIKTKFARHRTTINTRDIAFFCRQVSALLDAGIPIADALSIISQQIANKKLQTAVAEISDEVQTGISFSEAMKKQGVFPDLLVHMIASGEVSGTLNFVMRRMAEDYEKEYSMKKKISGAMVYPILIMVVAICAVVFVITSVLPRFVAMFESSGVELPLATQMLINLSEFIRGNWLLLLLALGLMVYFLIRFVRTSEGRFWLDSLKLKLPIIGGLNKKIISARFTRTLSSLLKSGIPLMQSLEYVAAVVGNKIIRGKIINIKEDISEGANLTDSVRKAKFFEPVLIHMVKIGEDSGKLDEVMENTARIYDDEVDSSVQGLTSIIEPLMIIFMAVVVGALVFAIISPMFDMAQTLEM